MIGIIFNPCAFWIGAHYSGYNKRLCINFIPFFTIYFAAAAGRRPENKHQIIIK